MTRGGEMTLQQAIADWRDQVGPGTPNPVCGACGAAIWNTISTRFSGTEACMSFCIEEIRETR